MIDTEFGVTRVFITHHFFVIYTYEYSVLESTSDSGIVSRPRFRGCLHKRVSQ